jgi:hypothetical protein
MRAAWYEKQGPARDVLVVGELPDPHPGPYPRVIPHSDGAGQVATAYLLNGSASECGAMARNLIGRSARPQSSRLCH